MVTLFKRSCGFMSEICLFDKYMFACPKICIDDFFQTPYSIPTRQRVLHVLYLKVKKAFKINNGRPP